MPKRYWWVECYRNCGCCSEANRKKDLLGYCAIHGTDVAERYKLPMLNGKEANIVSEALGQPPGVGDISFCRFCGKQIRHMGGGYWQHVDCSICHPARPAISK